MSAFNTLHLEMACPTCGIPGEREIQFRYGHVFQHDYVLGQTLQWGPGAIGDPAAKCVAVDGWTSDCPRCHSEGRLAIFLREGAFWGIGPISWVPSLTDQGWTAIQSYPGIS